MEAIAPHLNALVLVGAQAVYIHTGESDLAVAPYTTDADLALEPALLGPEPRLEIALRQAGFTRAENEVGTWRTLTTAAGKERIVSVDLLVPESLGGPGRRSAHIPPHAPKTARKAAGLEGALVDRELKRIRAQDLEDPRELELMVAGPAALIVAKAHKIMDREGDVDRRSDKDALDVYRLLRTLRTEAIGAQYQALLADPMSRDAAARAREGLQQLFGWANAPGTQMAVRAVEPLESGEILAASLVALTQELLGTIG